MKNTRIFWSFKFTLEKKVENDKLEKLQKIKTIYKNG